MPLRRLLGVREVVPRRGEVGALRPEDDRSLEAAERGQGVPARVGERGRPLARGAGRLLDGRRLCGLGLGALVVLERGVAVLAVALRLVQESARDDEVALERPRALLRLLELALHERARSLDRRDPEHVVDDPARVVARRVADEVELLLGDVEGVPELGEGEAEDALERLRDLAETPAEELSARRGEPRLGVAASLDRPLDLVDPLLAVGELAVVAGVLELELDRRRRALGVPVDRLRRVRLLGAHGAAEQAEGDGLAERRLPRLVLALDGDRAQGKLRELEVLVLHEALGLDRADDHERAPRAGSAAPEETPVTRPSERRPSSSASPVSAALALSPSFMSVSIRALT